MPDRRVLIVGADFDREAMHIVVTCREEDGTVIVLDAAEILAGTAFDDGYVDELRHMATVEIHALTPPKLEHVPIILEPRERPWEHRNRRRFKRNARRGK